MLAALPPPVPDAPAQYAALVRFYAQAEADQHPDPAADATARLAQMCETVLCARTAARLGLPWPAVQFPAAALAAVAFTPAAEPVRAVLRYTDAAYALIDCLEGVGAEALDALRREVARRPVRTLRALHGHWVRAWQGAHAARVGDPAFAACLTALGSALAACGQGAEGASDLARAGRADAA